MMARRALWTGLVAAAAAGLSACASPATDAAAPAGPTASAVATESSSLSPSASPPAAAPSPATPPASVAATSRPSGATSSGPPRLPTDTIKKTPWVVGTITIGGTGPCYELITDAGTRYALHAADGTNLIKGSRMRVRTATATARIACGPGKLVEMTAAEPLR